MMVPPRAGLVLRNSGVGDCAARSSEYDASALHTTEITITPAGDGRYASGTTAKHHYVTRKTTDINTILNRWLREADVTA